MSILLAGPLPSVPVVLVPGEGIGPEVVESAREVLTAAGAPITWDVRELPDLRAPAGACRSPSVGLRQFPNIWHRACAKMPAHLWSPAPRRVVGAHSWRANSEWG